MATLGGVKMNKKKYLRERKKLKRLLILKINGEGNEWFKEFVKKELNILELKNSK